MDKINLCKRRVFAPQFYHLSSSAIISVLLSYDEDVQWQWTHYPDGTSQITGYSIVKKNLKEKK